MENTKKINALSAFDGYLRILKAYNIENFNGGDRIHFVRNVCFVFGVTISVAQMAIVSILAIWYTIDYGCALQIVFAAIPSILTVLQFFVTFLAFASNNRIISETIERIQNIIERRKCRFAIIFKATCFIYLSNHLFRKVFMNKNLSFFIKAPTHIEKL